MERIIELGLLYDFYGELLTKHQQQVYEAAVYNDLSLSEIAQDMDISRQGVHDLLKRCDKTLLEYEGKLHLVERFQNMKDTATRMRGIIDQMCKDMDVADKNYDKLLEIRKLSEDVLKEL